MESLSFVQWLGGVGGVGAIFGFLMYLALRESIKITRQDRKYMEDRLTNVISDYNKICANNQDVMLKHTQVSSELITWLKARNGSKF